MASKLFLTTFILFSLTLSNSYISAQKLGLYINNLVAKDANIQDGSKSKPFATFTQAYNIIAGLAGNPPPEIFVYLSPNIQEYRRGNAVGRTLLNVVNLTITTWMTSDNPFPCKEANCPKRATFSCQQDSYVIRPPQGRNEGKLRFENLNIKG